eukprot:4584555-Prymnesium_polylepis.1
MSAVLMTDELGAQLSQVALWCVLCTVLFGASLQFGTPSVLTERKDRWYWASCVVGSLHAGYTSIMAVWVLASGTVPMWDRFGAPAPSWEYVVQVSLGFYIYDTVLTLCSPSLPGKAALLFHHFLAIVNHFYPVCVHHQFAAISAGGYLSELSTPLVNARWMLEKAGGGGSTMAYTINGVLMMV